MTTQAEKMLDRARSGERLGSSERRHCVAYLMVTDPGMTKVSMGELFQVSEGQIRADVLKIRKEKAAMVRGEDPGLVFADIAITFEKQTSDIEEAKAELAKEKGGKTTRLYLEMCRFLNQAQKDRIGLLQDLGMLARNLGNMTTTKLNYTAVVTQDGSVDTRPTNLLLGDGGEILEADCEEVPQK